jgi:hypothetical protein
MAVSTQLKRSILANTFLADLRIDRYLNEGEFQRLCDDIAQLGHELDGAASVDKELAALFFVAPQMLEGIRGRLVEDGSPEATRLLEMRTTLNERISRALHGPLPSELGA